MLSFVVVCDVTGIWLLCIIIEPNMSRNELLSSFDSDVHNSWVAHGKQKLLEIFAIDELKFHFPKKYLNNLIIWFFHFFRGICACVKHWFRSFNFHVVITRTFIDFVIFRLITILIIPFLLIMNNDTVQWDDVQMKDFIVRLWLTTVVKFDCLMTSISVFIL